MKKSLEVIEKNDFPIHVTRPLPKDELKEWETWFADKAIPTHLKGSGNGKYTLWRKITKQELQEVRSGKVIIKGGSFQVNRSTKKARS